MWFSILVLRMFDELSYTFPLVPILWLFKCFVVVRNDFVFLRSLETFLSDFSAIRFTSRPYSF